ncbi:hypothetical protein LA080_002679 [Diaporthe eres]|nr:hypothetical protein LA080_002679 [Diaporthe eres]
MAALKIPPLPFLAWAIWALILPVTMAHHHHVKWEDLMVATNKFPRFFGEVPSINRTGSPRVVGLGYKHGSFIYTGEPDHRNSTPSCIEFAARDTAEHTSLNQPFWDALYPPKESKLLYTVQDGRLYLTWRVTFNLKEKVGDDFIVWIDARDCRRVVAAAPAKMDLFIKSLEDFDKASDQLFLDHGLRRVHG